MTASHEHNHELVMALAEGPDDASSPEVRRQLAECSTCLHDLTLQRTALEVLRGAPAVGLTDIEAAQLRRSLRTALDHPIAGSDQDRRSAAAGAGTQSSGTQSSGTQSSRNPGVPAWYRFLGAAAVLVAVAIAVPVLGSLSGGDDDSDGGGDEVAAVVEESAEDESARSTMEDAPGEGGADADVEMMMEDTTTAVASEQAFSVTAPMDGAEGSTVVDTLEDLRNLVTDVDPDTARLLVEGEADVLGWSVADDDGCTAAGSLLIGTPVESYTLGTVTLDAEGITVLVTVHRDSAGSTTLVAHDPDTCGVLQATS